MGTEGLEISSLQALLTLARWHLDASHHAASDGLRRHRERARQVYDSIRRAIPHSQLSPAEREALELELSALRSRIDELAIPARGTEERFQAT